MKIGIGSDHGGYKLKVKLSAYLEDLGYEVIDYGNYNNESVDYPDIAEKTCNAYKNNEFDYGILICGTGIGISIAANKIKGIRAAHVTDSFSAKMAKEHNNANFICLGGRITGIEIAYTIVDAFLNAEFGGGRHERRVEKIIKLEK